MNEATSNEMIERLKEHVDLHQVCYEVWPEVLMVAGERVKVGFNLELFGTHQHGESRLSPGCRKCVRTYEDLQQIAEWIMPDEERSSRYEIEPFDRGLHETQKRKYRPEVVLSIKIVHRQGFDQPVDECEELCLKEMRSRLAQLGVLEGEWRSDRDSGRQAKTASAESQAGSTDL